jgi:hypothetical protein
LRATAERTDGRHDGHDGFFLKEFLFQKAFIVSSFHRGHRDAVGSSAAATWPVVETLTALSALCRLPARAEPAYPECLR